MATDKNGRELKVGDEVLVKAVVTSVDEESSGEIGVRLVPWGDDLRVDKQDLLMVEWLATDKRESERVPGEGVGLGDYDPFGADWV